MFDLKQYMIDRDNAIIECWETENIKPLNEFVRKYKDVQQHGVYSRWQRSDKKTKMLMLAQMTLVIPNKEIVNKYKDRAIEVRDKILKSMDNDPAKESNEENKIIS